MPQCSDLLIGSVHEYISLFGGGGAIPPKNVFSEGLGKRDPHENVNNPPTSVIHITGGLFVSLIYPHNIPTADTNTALHV